MDTETREAFTTVHGRVNKIDEAILKLTKQMSELVGIHKAQADAKAAEKPSMSPIQQQWLKLKFDVGKIAILALTTYFVTHAIIGH